MADEDRNQLYDPVPDSFNDRWSGLPVETPEYNLTPNVALVRSQPRQIDAPYKFVPIEGDPFERAAERTKAPYKHVNKLTDDKFPYRSNLPLIADKFINTAISGATAARDAYTGALQVSDPLTGMPTEDAIKRSIDVAALGGPGGLVESQPGVVVGSGMMRPKSEVLDRVLPAVKNTETGKIATVKRGEDHADILHRIWTKQGGDPNVSTQTLYDMVVEGGGGPKHETGFYDPKTKEFHPRTSPEWQNIDSPDLMPKRSMTADRVFSDTSKPGQALAAMTDAPAFYSAVEHAVNNTHQNKMPAEQWIGTLNNAKGVKPEEMDWTGLKDFLAEKGKTPVTKAEMQEHLNTNKVELKEVNKGESNYYRPVYKDSFERNLEPFKDLPISNADDVMSAIKHNPYFKETVKGKSPAQILDALNEAKNLPDLDHIAGKKYDTKAEAEAAIKGNENHLDVKEDNVYKDTKYHSYQLPGGENYREMLLTQPLKTSPKAKEAFDLTKRMQESEFNSLDEIDRRALFAKRDNLLKEAKAEEGEPYRSSHWDEPNVLAHIRMNDRDIEGKKSLHIEEIQSDWHQAGRDKGYREGRSAQEIQSDIDSLYNQLTPKRSNFSDHSGMTERYGVLKDELQKANEGVPDAPFKKSWHELALKRMIREAAEKGYDRISWTPGEAQAARYDLSKQIENITLHREKNEKGGTIQAYDKNGKQVIMKNVNDAEKELPDIIGKESTEKLLKQESKEVRGSYRKVQELKNADLKVGGEGMKGFYDKMLPNAIEKIGKEHGVKVKTGNLPTDKDKILKNRNTTVPDIEAQEKYKDKWNKLVEKQQELAKNIHGYDKISHEDYPKHLEKYNENTEAMDKIHEKMVDETINRMIKNGKGEPVHYIDIPQSLRDVAMKKGFPLFSSGYPGMMLTPIEGDPFNRKK